MKIEMRNEDLKNHFEKFFHGTGVSVKRIKTSNAGIVIEGEVESLVAGRERDLAEAEHQGELKLKLQPNLS